MPTDRNLNAGDGDYHRGDSILLDAGGNDVSGGDAVKFDGSGNITPTTASTDDFIGVVLPEAEKSDNKWTVHIAGKVVAIQLASDATASAGDTLIPSGTDNGRFDASADGMVVNTGSADADAYLNHPFALEDGGNDDVILAAMR